MPDVRLATPADALAVAAVHIRSWQAGYRGIIPDDFLDSLSAEERAKRYTFVAPDPPGPRTVLAVEHVDDTPTGSGERILGFATTGMSRDADAAHAAELYALYVDPTSWHSGVGRMLMSAAYRHFEALDVPEAILWMLVGNAHAARFYDADGWQPDGSRRDEDVWEVPVTVVRFRRTLR